MRGKVVLVAVVSVLVSGCTSTPAAHQSKPDQTGHQATASAPPSHAPSPSPSATSTPGDPREALTLLPDDCGHSDLRIAMGPQADAVTGEMALNYAVRNTGSRACTLMGYPRVRLLDARGVAMPFHYRRGSDYIQARTPRPYVVRPGHRVFFLVSKYRCDVKTLGEAVTARVRLPLVDGVFKVPARGDAGVAHIALCGKHDPPQNVGVSPIGASESGMDTPGNLIRPATRPALSMHARLGLPRRPSYGRGDLNGDGRADLVVVRPGGLVTARVSGLGRRSARVPADNTLRLQALADLSGDGRDVAVLASTTSGASDGYILPDSRSTVLALTHERLRVVRRADGRTFSLEFDQGRGDLYAGVRCDDATLRQVSVLQTGERSLKVTTTRFRMSADKVIRTSKASRQISGAAGRAFALASSQCHGMNPRGWAR